MINMATYVLLPKIDSIGLNTIETCKEFVLYKHLDNDSETIEFPVIKSENVYKFADSDNYAYDIRPSNPEYEFLKSLNNSNNNLDE